MSDLEEDEFFKFHKWYDLIPTSTNVVVFDTQLLVKKACFDLMYNGVRATLLWDSSQQEFLRETKIATYDDIEVAYEDTSIIVALKKFLGQRVSALPLVDSQGPLVDIYAEFDVINLAAV
ncbi:hypothetical protein FQA39_LY04360 [Lamprigera yunnana]|nr:hypothetical protein FQA39_LY04360 [Lamprigera yunnana]